MVNFSNNLIIKPSSTFIPYKVFVGKGNNSFAVKNVVKNRWWMQVVENLNEINNANICWT